MRLTLEMLFQDLIIFGRVNAFAAVYYMSIGVMLTCLFGLVLLLFSVPVFAQTVPYMINFQGRLSDNSGNVLSDGSYNIKFRLYNVATGGTAQWEEDRVYGATDNRVTVKNGLFNIQLGSLASLSPSLFDSYTEGNLYLEVELPTPLTATCASNGCAIWTEGAMTPRQELASSPYAFNADNLDGLAASAFGQLPAAQTWASTNTFSSSGAAAIVLSGSAASGGSILQIGGALTGGNAAGTLFGTNTTSAGDLLNLQVANSVKLDVNNSGDITSSGSFQFTQGTNHSLAVAQAVSGIGNNLTIQAGSGATNADDGGNLVLEAGAAGGSGGSGTSGSVIVAANSIQPTANNTTDFGTTGGAFKDAYVTNIDSGLISTALTIGTLNAAHIQIGKSGVAAGIPGGITTSGGTINSGSGSISSTGAISGGTLSGSSGVSSPAYSGTAAVSLSSGGTSALSLTSGSGTIILGSNILQRAGPALTLDLATNATSQLSVLNSSGSNVANLSVSGGLTIGLGQSITVGSTIGAAATCTGGQILQNQTVVGGVVTGGTCVSASSPTLQNVYDNSTSPATVNLNTSAKDFVINATDQATDPNILFNLECTTCSSNAGRFAVQDSGKDIFTINPSGQVVVAPTSGQNLSINLASSSGIVASSSSAPSVDQVHIDNSASSGVTTNGVSGLSVNYKGGAASVSGAGMTIDFEPGATSGGNWDGVKIVANATGAATGVNEYGLELDGPTSPGTGNEEGEYLGTGWDIGIDIQSGGIQLDAQTQPTTPTGSNLRIWAQNIAGRIMPKWMGPAGVDTPFQASLGFNRVSWCTPAGGATLTTFISCMGSTFTNVGTPANPTPTSTNLLDSTRRATYSTSATAGTLGSSRQSTTQVWRGNAAGEGGYFYTIRFGTPALQTGNRSFVGLADVTSAPTNIDPTTSSTPGRVGLAINASTGDWNLVSNVSGTAATSSSLGSSFPVDTTSLYELVLFAAPDGTSIGYRVTNLSTGAQTSGSLSTNIPTATDFLAPEFWITNNATAAVATLAFGGWYLESDN